MDLWPEIVELYEYKVADVAAGREPRGGRRSVVALRDTLLYASLDPALMRRFRQADKLWRDRDATDTPPTPKTSFASFQEADNWSMPNAAPLDPEGETLARLGFDLWRLHLDAELGRLLSGWRRETNLVTLRSLYALSLNLEAGKLTQGVPEEHDPLVSLGNPKVALAMLSGLLDQLLEHDSETQTPIAWARAMMLELAQTPFVNERRPSTSFTPETERRTGAARSSERTQIREALGRGVEALAQLLPLRLGGSGEDYSPPTRVLNARNPARRTPAPDDELSTFALRLAGPGETRWHGHDIAWQPLGGAWQLLVAGAAYPLPRVGEVAHLTRVPLDGRELRVLARGDYLLFELEDGEHASLPTLLALGRAVSVLLEPEEQYMNLRLARGAAQWLRDGRLDAASLGPDSAAKYDNVTPDVLFGLARKGVQSLLARLERRPLGEVTRAIQEAARAVGCPDDQAQRLLQLLRDATLPEAPEEVGEVRGSREAAFVAYQGDPLTVNVAGRVLTLRADYKGAVTAVLPGAPAVPVRDLWVFALPKGGVIVARQGLRLAVAYQPTLA